MKGSIIQRGKDTWRIRVSLGTNKNGRRIYVTRTVKG